MKDVSPHKWVLGLTGRMLSGKSTALEFFKQNGAAVFSADEAVAALYKKPAVQTQIKKLIGTLDKEQIAALTFADPQKRSALEKLLHPLVWAQAKQFVRQTKNKLVVLEIPLLFEANWQHYFDFTLVIAADPKTLPQRLKGRGLTLKQYKQRTQYQWPPEKQYAQADMVLFHRNKTDLKNKINRLCKLFTSLHKARS